MNFLKQIISFSLAFIFFLSVSGINVYKHYCGNLLEEISVYIQSNPCADEGGEDACSKGKASSCCDDDVEFYQLDITLHSSTSKDIKFQKIQSVIKLFAKVPFKNIQDVEGNIRKERAPPNLSFPPIYKRLSRYTFYG